LPRPATSSPGSGLSSRARFGSTLRERERLRELERERERLREREPDGLRPRSLLSGASPVSFSAASIGFVASSSDISF
jgi:hypothetical protein